MNNKPSTNTRPPYFCLSDLFDRTERVKYYERGSQLSKTALAIKLQNGLTLAEMRKLRELISHATVAPRVHAPTTREWKDRREGTYPEDEIEFVEDRVERYRERFKRFFCLVDGWRDLNIGTFRAWYFIQLITLEPVWFVDNIPIGGNLPREIYPAETNEQAHPNMM